jgi:DNA-binding transcriptional LysR family regulator
VTDPLLQDVLDDWWYSHYQEAPRTTIVTDAMDTAMKMVQQGLGFTLLSQSCGQDTPDIRPIPLTSRGRVAPHAQNLAVLPQRLPAGIQHQSLRGIYGRAVLKRGCEKMLFTPRH